MLKSSNSFSMPPLKKGDRIKGGQYEIIDNTVNEGGFGRIYRAYGSRRNNDNTRHVVAIKEFFINELQGVNGRSVSLGDYSRAYNEEEVEAWREKFFYETRVLAKLNEQRDRHVPWVHAWSGDKIVFEDNGRLFYAMTFIEGMTLREAVEKCGVMDEGKAIDYAIQIAKVLYKAHKWGFTHCDVSPNNIMLQDGFAVLVDFGNARSYDIEWVQQNEPRAYAGTSGFTPPYSAYVGSEQGDIYSLAATLFYLLTGVAPHLMVTECSRRKNVALLQNKNVSDSTIRAIMNALDTESENCITSAKDFLLQLPNEMVVNSLLNYNDINFDKL